MVKKIITFCATICVLAACNNKVDYNYPQEAKEKRREEVGSLITKEKEGGILLFGGKKSSHATMSANEYLWKAALEVINFMPLQQSDSVGGVIITDWYADPSAPKERFKMNIFITSSELNANAVKVSVFKQVSDDKGNWHEAVAGERLARELEDKIISRARELRIGK